MPPSRKVAPRQLVLLLEFAESHRDIAVGRFAGGPLASQRIRQVWENITNRLNAVAEGTTKSPDQWRRYWIDLKAKTKSKAADSRRSARATGGPSKLKPLNEMEERIISIIGPMAVEGLPRVRMDIPDEVISEEWIEEEVFVKQVPTASPALEQVLTASPALEQVPTASPALEHVSPASPALEHVSTASPVLVHVQQEPPHRVQVDTPHRSASATSSRVTQRLRPQRQNHRDTRVPQWAYEMEIRRIAAEERHATAMEALVDLIREIKDSINNPPH